MAVMEAFCRDLTEHVDAVQVIATNCENGRTEIYAFGTGNYYARLGSCKEFVDRDRGVTFARALINEERREPGDGPPLNVGP